MTQVSTLGRLAVVTAGVLGIATACGSTSTPATSSSSSSSSAKIGGSVTVWAEWTSQEQQDFLAALAPFRGVDWHHRELPGQGQQHEHRAHHRGVGRVTAGRGPRRRPRHAANPGQARLDQGSDQHPRQHHLQLRRRLEHAGDLQRQAVRRVVQGREQEHHLLQPGAVHRGGITSPPTTWSSCSPTPRS